MSVLAFLSDPPVLAKILAHLGLKTTPPSLGPARYPEQLDLFDDAGECDSHPQRTGLRPRPGRGPPSGEPADWVVEPDEPADTGDWGA